jgi:hypothetical protein
VSIVQVDQVCARPRRRKDDGDDGGDDDDDDDGDDDPLEESHSREIDYVHDDTREENLEIWTISGSTPFRGVDRHEVYSRPDIGLQDADLIQVTMLPCNGKRSAVKSYKISLCLGDGKCISTSNERKICSYETGKKGYKFGNAVEVDDVDDWRWNI